MMLLRIWQIQSKGISYLNARRLCTSWTITQKSVTAWMSTNQHIYHNKRLRERFICFIRGAKWMKINRLNGPSTIHDGYFNIASLKYPIYDTCLLLIGYAKKSPLKVLQNSFPPLWFPVNKCFPAGLTHAQMLPFAVECCIWSQACNIWEYFLRKPFPRNEVFRIVFLWPWNPNMTWLEVD